MHSPVRLSMATAAASLLLFTSVVGWGHAERTRSRIDAPAPEVVAQAVQRERYAVPARSGARTPLSPRPLADERQSVSGNLSLGGAFVWPVIAPVSSPFGPRWGRSHAGIDLAANHGDPIRAARSGKVLLAGTVTGYGFTVVLQHPDGTRTLYAHCSTLLVHAGQNVSQGDLIARVGATGDSQGPHLHFEIIVNERPHDPLLYLPKDQIR